MWRDVRVVAAKDLRIEWRSRVTFSQVVPFAGLVLVLFGFALDANRPVLEQATSGLFWVTIMFASTLAVQRSTTVETTDGARRALLGHVTRGARATGERAPERLVALRRAARPSGRPFAPGWGRRR